jgi:hypothetical protein
LNPIPEERLNNTRSDENRRTSDENFLFGLNNSIFHTVHSLSDLVINCTLVMDSASCAPTSIRIDELSLHELERKQLMNLERIIGIAAHMRPNHLFDHRF